VKNEAEMLNRYWEVRLPVGLLHLVWISVLACEKKIQFTNNFFCVMKRAIPRRIFLFSKG
jgi:hypothetical protein